MVNKFHKAYQVGKQVYSKLAKSAKKTDAEEHFDTVYKKDKTGKTDKMVEGMNKTMKEKKHSASPAMTEAYHKAMTKGSKYTENYWKKRKPSKTWSKE